MAKVIDVGAAVLSENDRLREENARLTRERDEARAEVERLEGLILDWEESPVVDLEPLEAEARRIRAQRGLDG